MRVRVWRELHNTANNIFYNKTSHVALSRAYLGTFRCLITVGNRVGVGGVFIAGVEIYLKT